jgi:hypothetical protein
MRLWLSGPRILHGLVRPGISLGREDFRRMRKPPAVSAAGMLGIFKRDTDGAIFLGVPDQNGENEHLANIKSRSPHSGFRRPMPPAMSGTAHSCAWANTLAATACWLG